MNGLAIDEDTDAKMAKGFHRRLPQVTSAIFV